MDGHGASEPNKTRSAIDAPTKFTVKRAWRAGLGFNLVKPEPWARLSPLPGPAWLDQARAWSGGLGA
jgi:hypothetical protein